MINIGAELFAQAAACSRAQMLHTSKDPEERAQGAAAQDLADLFCLHSRRRIKQNFKSVFNNDDVKTYALAQRVLAGEFKWLEEGTSLTE